jgi:hypothetical protein
VNINNIEYILTNTLIIVIIPIRKLIMAPAKGAASKKEGVDEANDSTHEK